MMRIIIREAWDRNGYNLWLMKDGRIAKPFAMEFGEQRDENSAWMLPDPSLFIRREEFIQLRQSIASEALANGFTELVNPFRDQLSAVKYHLEDMRKLVFEPPRIENVIAEERR